MTKFILLHRAGRKRYINANLVESVTINSKDETIIFTTGGSTADFYRVDEDIDEVMGLINEARS